MKVISQFRIGQCGLFIDLDDAPASVSVDEETGAILLNEGEGPDRYHGAAIRPENYRGLFLRQGDGGQAEIVLRFVDGSEHVLGITTRSADAKEWIKSVESLPHYRTKNGREASIQDE